MSGNGNEKSHYIHGQWPEQWRPDTLTLPPQHNSYTYQFGNIQLPVAAYRDHIISTIANNQITVLTSPTGSGKTTQLPQWLYEEGYHVTITQPRIIAARTNSERIRQEMVDVAGPEAAKLVGYRTANEGDSTPENRILLCTDGLQVMHEITEKVMSGDRVIMLDEIHERNANMDLLLALLKRRAAQDPSFRAVIASATLDAHKYARYFTDDNGIAAPVIELPGKTFEVVELDRDDAYEAIVEFGQKGLNVAAIVPGKPDVEKAIAAVKRHLPKNHVVLPVHGEMCPADQQKIFKSYEGGKIIIGTNILQSSITVPDLDVMVSSGYGRANDLQRTVEGLYQQPIAIGTEEQQRGRVGRTKPGIFVRAPLDGYPELPPPEERDKFDKPEIQRKRLDGIVLKLARSAIGLDGLEFMDMPEGEAVYDAIDRLRKIGAMAIDGSVTKIGKEMAYLPLDPHFARMLIASRDFDEAIRKQIIAAIAVQQDHGITATGAEVTNKWNKLSDEKTSDILMDLDIFIAALSMNASEIENHGIVAKKFYKAREVYLSLSELEGLSEAEITVPTDEEREALLACIISGADELYIHLGGNRFRDPRGYKRKVGKRSAIGKSRKDIIIGAPFDLSNLTETGSIKRRFIKGATVVSAEELAQSAPERCTYETMNYFINKAGVAKIKKAMFFDDIDTGAHIIEVPEPSAELKEFMVRNLVAGTYQNLQLPNSAKLQTTIKRLYDVQSRTKDKLDIDIAVDLIINNLLHYIPDTVASPAEVDSYIPDYPINNFLSEGVEEAVLQSAPNHVDILGLTIRVNYSDGDAYISLPHYIGDTLPESIPELGDRQIFVRYAKDKNYRLLEDARVIAAQPARHQRRKSETSKTTSATRSQPSTPRGTQQNQPYISPVRPTKRPVNNHVRQVTGRR